MSGSFPNTSAPSRAATPVIQASRWPRVLFWILVASLLPIMVTASVDFGMTWDEMDRHKNGRAILDYYQGEVPRAKAHYGTMYPGLFDVIPAWLETRYDVDRYVLRHRVNAVFGWVGILFTGLLASRLFGPWSGILALILLAASPRYFAHSMNNPKDLPFAAMSVMVLYCLSRLSPRWPYLTVGTGAALAVALGLALGTRPGALLYFGYLPLLLLAMLIVQWISAVPRADRVMVRRWLRTILRIPPVHWTAGAELVARVSLVIVAGLLLGTVFWPWAQAEPFTRPFEALTRAGAYDWDGLVLFDGRQCPAGRAPLVVLANVVPDHHASGRPRGDGLFDRVCAGMGMAAGSPSGASRFCLLSSSSCAIRRCTTACGTSCSRIHPWSSWRPPAGRPC